MAWNDQTAPQQRPDVRPRWKKKRYLIPAAGLSAILGLGTVAAVTAPPVKDASSVVDQTTAAPVTTAPTTTAPTIRPTLPSKTLTPRTTRPPVVTAAPTTRAPAPRTVAPAPTTRPKPAPTTVRPKPAPTRTTPPPPPAAAVHPGAFCSPEGATGHTAKGTLMRCTRKPGEDRARWRKA